ncbi:hypothetical protein PAHAL_5G070700 [Panicum hallii]|uniref:Uncharacterized protein n=1 Tax=Panicum hallii TaxID=206008 RepID=A0A2S3HPF4_9POAL|nr:hypothetical protein PAHAL_5G070700 [Panicum hallii]
MPLYYCEQQLVSPFVYSRTRLPLPLLSSSPPPLPRAAPRATPPPMLSPRLIGSRGAIATIGTARRRDSGPRRPALAARARGCGEVWRDEASSCPQHSLGVFEACCSVLAPFVGTLLVFFWCLLGTMKWKSEHCP